MTPDLPRLITRGLGHEHLVTRKEAAAALGYSPSSMARVMWSHRDRWPGPVAMLRTGRAWALLWDLDALLAVAPHADATTRRGGAATITDADGLLTCLECGRRFRALGRHVNHAHGLTAGEYRERHRLPATGALLADAHRVETSQRMRSALEDDPRTLAHLARFQGADRLDAMREDAIKSNRRTMTYETTVERRAPARRYAVQVMQGRRREALDRQVQAHGYADMDSAVRATLALTQRDAARQVGVSASTIGRARRRLADRA